MADVQTQAPASPVIGVAEIVLNVTDILGMSKFYQETLGFRFHSSASMATIEVDSESDSTIVFLKIGDTQTPLGANLHPQLLVLIDYQRHVFAKERFVRCAASRSTLNHLAFEILESSYVSEQERLTQLGLNPVETVFESMKAKAIFFKDPEGNTLELICHSA